MKLEQKDLDWVREVDWTNEETSDKSGGDDLRICIEREIMQELRRVVVDKGGEMRRVRYESKCPTLTPCANLKHQIRFSKSDKQV